MVSASCGSSTGVQAQEDPREERACAPPAGAPRPNTGGPQGQEGLPKAPGASLPWQPPRRPSKRSTTGTQPRPEARATPTPHSHLPPCQMGTLEVVTPTFVLRAPGGRGIEGLVLRDTPADAAVWRTVHLDQAAVSRGDPQAATEGAGRGRGQAGSPGRGSGQLQPPPVCAVAAAPWASSALGPRSGASRRPTAGGRGLLCAHRAGAP